MGQSLITNKGNISISMAVWLATDTYSAGTLQDPTKEMISATTLLKPTRQFILSQQVPVQESTVDVTDLISNRLGHAIHSSIEESWRNNYAESMKKLGYPQKLIDAVRINPEVDDEPDTIPVYLEQRYYREIDGVVISGQFDQIINGEIEDVKSTSVWSYLGTNKDDDYIRQLSIYRWINPDKVTSDIGRIQHVFTDWQRMMLKQNPNYPAHRVIENKFNLMSLSDTENWIRSKLNEIRYNINLTQERMVRCTKEELWMSDPQYKYYADPVKAKEGGRSTKNFDNLQSAHSHRDKAGKGVIITVPAEVKACGYCPAFPICEQRKEYIPDA